MPTTPTDRVDEAIAARDTAVQRLDTTRALHTAALHDLAQAQARAAEAVVSDDHDDEPLTAVQVAIARAEALGRAIHTAEEAVERAEREIVKATDAARLATMREHLDAMEAAADEADAHLAALAPHLATIRDRFNQARALAPRHVMTYGGPSLYLGLAVRARLRALTGDDVLSVPNGVSIPATGSVTQAVRSVVDQLSA